MAIGRRPLAACAVALAIAIGADLALFRTPFYHALLAPDSAAGSFEGAIASLRSRPADPGRDVLVVGDSRIYDGLEPELARRSAGGRLRFVRAAIPGTTPRCWHFLVDAVDPARTRYRALVIPVDGYADDDTSLGAIDGDEREADLAYLAYRVPASGILAFASGFHGIAVANAAAALALRAPLLHDDVRALLADPPARFAALDRARRANGADLVDSHARAETLAGLHADFATGTLVYPQHMPPPERRRVADEVLPVARPSAAYAAYRSEWLGPLVRSYLRAGRRVVFVRIPTRPAHRAATETPDGSILAFVRDGAVALDARPYLALERPELFSDQVHLNRTGAALFSRRLGRDLAIAVGR